mgnify:CR=1 FL=1
MPNRASLRAGIGVLAVAGLVAVSASRLPWQGQIFPPVHGVAGVGRGAPVAGGGVRGRGWVVRGGGLLQAKAVGKVTAKVVAAALDQNLHTGAIME